MIKTIKHRFYPTKDQEILLRRTLGCVRFIYNKSLDFKSSTFTQTGKSLSSFDLMKELTKWKRQPEYSWLNEVSNVCLQQAIKNLGAAFDNFLPNVPNTLSLKRNLQEVQQDLLLQDLESKITKFILLNPSNL